MASSAGALLQRAIEVEVALDAGFSLGLADVTAEEWQALLTLRSERNRYQAERQDEAKKSNGWPIPNTNQ